jgi:hypothetical protein
MAAWSLLALFAGLPRAANPNDVAQLDTHDQDALTSPQSSGDTVQSYAMSFHVRADIP